MTEPDLDLTGRHSCLDSMRDALRVVRAALLDFEEIYLDAVDLAPSSAHRLQKQLGRFFSGAPKPRRLDRELNATLRALRVWKSTARRYSDALAEAEAGSAGHEVRRKLKVRARPDGGAQR